MMGSLRVITKQGHAWALLPVLLLLGMFVGWGVMLSLALDDPGFAVEPNYYHKAVHHDARLALEQESRRLGWSLEVEARRLPNGQVLYRAKLADAKRTGVSGAEVSAEAFHLARSSRIQTLHFSESRPGEYQAQLATALPGLWELRFRAERGVEHFIEVARVEVHQGSSP